MRKQVPSLRRLRRPGLSRVSMFSGGVFNPNLLPSPLVRYRADQGVYTSRAASFAAASSEYLSAATASGVTNKLSISAWCIKTANIDTMIVSETDAGGTVGWTLQFNADGQLQSYIGTGGFANAGQTATLTVALNAWHHVVMIYDGTLADNATRLKIWLNGVQQSLTFSGTIPASISTTGVTPWVGAYPGGFYFTGRIQGVGLWSAALTSGDVAILYNSSFGGLYADLSGLSANPLYWWNLTEASGTRASSATANNLTDNNTVASGAGYVPTGLAANGDPAVRLTDLTGNGFHAQCFTANCPTYVSSGVNGKPIIRWAGAEKEGYRCGLVSGANKPNNWSVYATLAPDAQTKMIVANTFNDAGEVLSTWGMLMLNDETGTSGSYGFGYGDGTHASFGNSDGSLLVNDTWCQITGVYTAGQSQAASWFNGVSKTLTDGIGDTSTACSGTASQFYLGSWSPVSVATGQQFAGDLAEIASYGAAHGTADRQAMEANMRSYAGL